MTDTNNVPLELIELTKNEKPRDYADGLIRYYENDVRSALNYEMISQPRGGALSLDSFLAAVKLDVASNDRLAEAMRSSPGSFLKSVLLAAQCKLLPGGAYNLFYLIPRWNGKKRANEVTPLIGYKGLMDLAQRHPRVHKIEAHLVYEGETFDYDAGIGKLTHKVNLLGDRDPSKVIGGYARAVITEPSTSHPVLDDPVVFVMSREEIDAVMRRSDAWKNAEEKGWRNSPWHTDWKPMAKKTLIRALMNSGAVPKDMGVGGALHQEAQHDIPPAAPALPSPTRQSAIRASLGLDEEQPPFEFAEEAVAAIQAAGSVQALKLLADRWQHFAGSDAETIARAYEDREAELA